MQEDKTSKWLADQLRKQQEENPLPYELGAWEAFEKKRIAASGKNVVYYWISGLAASLTILFVAGGLWLAGETELPESSSLSDQSTLEEKPVTNESQTTNPQAEEKSTAIEGQSIKGNNTVLGSSKNAVTESRTPNSAKKASPNKISNEGELNSVKNLAEIDQKVIQENIYETDPILPQTGSQENSEKETSKQETPEKVIAAMELPKDPLLNEEEIKEILESKPFATIVMGLTPGFGASQGTEQNTSGTSLGLGVMVDMELTRKLVMGSGVGLNYLNQASESQSYAQIAGFAAPVKEKNEIAQVQVDIPLYFKYPITRSQSISVQAGFSNLLTFNQYSEQQYIYTRQVAVLDANAAGANSFTLKSESVNQSSDLEVPQNRFYPFATANLGVNIRLFESKKSSYEVMPFYNYPLQEFSGYGEKLGMFGASFKVKFGAPPKK